MAAPRSSSKAPAPKFFTTPQAWRAWLEKHHADREEIWVGFFRKDSGKASITWPEAVDEALCFGWIDGIRKRVDDTSYMNRFTPRRKRSTWSAVNIKRMNELIENGLVHPAGLAAFARRSEDRSAIYSYEQRTAAQLTPDYDRRLRENKRATDFFEGQPPSYRRSAIYWVMSAKREDTRRRRLDRLIEDSAAGRTIAPLTRPTKEPGAGRTR